MPNFHYVVVRLRGARKKAPSSLEAHTAIDAMNQLRRRGLHHERLQRAEIRVAEEMRSEPVTATAEPTRAVVDAHTPKTVDVNLGIEELAEIAGRIAGITKSKLPLLPGLRPAWPRDCRRGRSAISK